MINSLKRIVFLLIISFIFSMIYPSDINMKEVNVHSKEDIVSIDCIVDEHYAVDEIISIRYFIDSKNEISSYDYNIHGFKNLTDFAVEFF